MLFSKINFITFMACFAALYVLGRVLGRLRPKRPFNTIRYSSEVLSNALILAGMAALFYPPQGHVMAVAMCAMFSVAAAYSVFVMLRYSLVIDVDGITIRNLLRPGWKRVPWSSIKSGRRTLLGSVVLVLRPSGRVAIRSWRFKEGSGDLLRELSQHDIPFSP